MAQTTMTGWALCLSSSPKLPVFDLARRQVDRVGDMASAEIITGTGIYHYRVFFINQASSFTAGDLFNLGRNGS
ncbi:Uncharacterised protein [Serratia fonticola]|uniref:Uncharacterized protein n=1 Tax=Serratia fonticola TaxID=47917 RepID=A0A4U9TLC6_SERFO|nr:Uncharacterised protein [Serratia fonticola]